MTASMNRPLIYLASAKTSKEQTALGIFETISEGKYLIRGFTNCEIRKAMGYIDTEGKVTQRNRMSRTLKKLRIHGLIKKVPHSRRYLVSDKGRRIMGALIETKKRTYPGLAAAL